MSNSIRLEKKEETQESLSFVVIKFMLDEYMSMLIRDERIVLQ